jgi:hypothetical protein
MSADSYAPTTGAFALAYLEHGSKPDFADCVYTLKPKATPETMRRYAANPTCQILQKNSQAHVARDRDSRTTGYILFQKGPILAAGPLCEVNRPCSVMVREQTGRLRISVASTDLDSWEREVKLSGELVLTLSGAWRPTTAGLCSTTAAGQTTLRLPYRTSQPMVMELEPYAAK